MYPLLFPEYNREGEFSKILLKKCDLDDFFRNTPPYDFLTVTMPHKLAVIPHCDILTEDATKIGSVNYISIEEGKLIGHNFDGIGALNVIEEKLLVKDKVVVVAGAGGAARAAIFEAKQRGAYVICVNRTESKGRALASTFNIEFQSQVPEVFDVLINATSIGMDSSDKRKIVTHIPQGKVVVDMASRDGVCLLNKMVTEAGGEYISGSKMFYALTRAGLQYLVDGDEKKAGLYFV